MNIKKIKREFNTHYELIKKEIKNLNEYKKELEFLIATIYFNSKMVFKEISLDSWKKFSDYVYRFFLMINKNNQSQNFDLDCWYLEIKELIKVLNISNFLLNKQLEQIYLKYIIFYWYNINIPINYEIDDFNIICLRNKAFVDCMQILKEYYHINVDILINLVIKQIR